MTNRAEIMEKDIALRNQHGWFRTRLGFAISKGGMPVGMVIGGITISRKSGEKKKQIGRRQQLLHS